ncbi:ABC transporter permease [Chloroflexota bacterium]
MNWRIIGALVSKDYSLFFRNRFYSVVTVLGIVLYLALYIWWLPKTIDESLSIGLYTPVALPTLEQTDEEGLTIQFAESEEALKDAVIEGDYIAGIAFPADITDSLISGQKPKIKAYFASDVPPEYKAVVELLIRELIYKQTGHELPIDISEEILGPDMIGMQIPPRDRMRPMLAVMLLIFETFGLASLITEEVERRTIQALLVTPVSIKGFFISKGITGVSLAFIQATLFMGITGGMGQQPLIIITTLLLGAVMVTGIGFIIAALSKDFMSVLAWGMVTLIPMFIPSFGVMFPGAVTGWIKFIPSYYLIDTVHRVANFGAGWGDIWTNLLIIIILDLVLVWIGIMALRRKSR